MQAADALIAFDSLTKNQRAALITLLADDDLAVYQMVRGRLLAYGPVICDWLKPHTLSGDPKLRRRAIELTTHYRRQAAHQRFLEFCHRTGEQLDLETGVGLLAQTRYPEINLEGYSALLDTWAETLREMLFTTSESGRVLEIVNRHVFEELGFSGNEQYGHDPESSYFNCILDRRTGNPIGLCLIFLLLARRLKLPVTGIGLPGHFVCRYQSSTREIFIDCFRHGALISKGDCVKYLLQSQGSPTDGSLSPISPRRMLLRMCHNLFNTYRRLEIDEESIRLSCYVEALSR
jgi:regulator of sirC expression with transglutaminase-like and TPR domain